MEKLRYFKQNILLKKSVNPLPHHSHSFIGEPVQELKYDLICAEPTVRLSLCQGRGKAGLPRRRTSRLAEVGSSFAFAAAPPFYPSIRQLLA